MIFPFLGIIGLGIAAIGCYAIFGGENHFCYKKSDTLIKDETGKY